MESSVAAAAAATSAFLSPLAVLCFPLFLNLLLLNIVCSCFCCCYRGRCSKDQSPFIRRCAFWEIWLTLLYLLLSSSQPMNLHFAPPAATTTSVSIFLRFVRPLLLLLPRCSLFAAASAVNADTNSSRRCARLYALPLLLLLRLPRVYWCCSRNYAFCHSYWLSFCCSTLRSHVL